MTAEIAVLNRNAVALAADSAVTLVLPEGVKIYQANKLFTLSKYRPVGVMVYGGADFMGIPWETIIKRYRAQLERRGFPRIEDYAANFLSFVEKSSRFFPAERQLSACHDLAEAWIRRLKVRLGKLVELKIKTNGSVTEQELRQKFREIVDEDISILRKHKVLARFIKISPRALLRTC